LYNKCDLYIFQQQTEPNYPEILLIAINKNGMNLIDPKSKVCVKIIVEKIIAYCQCTITSTHLIFFEAKTKHLKKKL
jgi:hypothetical protein